MEPRAEILWLRRMAGAGFLYRRWLTPSTPEGALDWASSHPLPKTRAQTTSGKNDRMQWGSGLGVGEVHATLTAT